MNVQAMSSSAGLNVKSAVSSAAEEARETASVTKAEAAKGDRQAIRKLETQQQQDTQQPRVSPEGVGKAVDLLA